MSKTGAASLCLLMLALFPLTIWGTRKALQSHENDIAKWLPDDQRLDWYHQRFGSEAVLAVGWKGCKLRDPRLAAMRNQLSSHVVASESQAGEATPVFSVVFDGETLLTNLASEPLSIPPKEAAARLQGWILGPGRTTCLVAVFSDAGWKARHATVEKLMEEAPKMGIPQADLYLGGPAIDSVTIDRISGVWLLPLGAGSALVGLLVSLLCLKRISFLVVTFSFASLAWLANLALLPVFGVHMDSVLIAMPALTYVLAVSSAVHLTGYFVSQSAQAHGVGEAILGAIRVGWAPCTLAAVTSTIGLASLATSTMVPVRNFGFLSAIGIMLAWGLLFLFWPPLMRIFADRKLAETPNSRFSNWWQPLYQMVVNRPWWIVASFLGCLPLLILGISRTQTSVRLSDLFSSSSDIHQDYAALEQSIGGLVPVEVIVHMAAPKLEEPTALLAKTNWIEDLRQHLTEDPAVTGAIAASTFLPRVETNKGLQAVVQRRVVALKIQDRISEIESLGFLRYEGDGIQLWRISGRVPALGDVDYAGFLDRLQSRVRTFIASSEDIKDAILDTTVCGGAFQVARAQDQLLKDLTHSLTLAFALIAIAMIWLTRSLRLGLISMVPNLFPSLLVFGVMGWMGVAIDVGSMMTVTVALGIAVDDTSHFLWWYFQGLRQGKHGTEAIRVAFEHCASAMLQTSTICGLGLAVFFLSPFLPIARFGLLMALLLIAALAGDLLLLPAILKLSPARRAELPKAAMNAPNGE